jgi:hypothetical protein
MCNFRGTYVPKVGKVGAEIGCQVGSGGSCLTCGATLMGQDPAQLCSDDGTPSSKDKYDDLNACTCGAAPDGCGAECGDNVCSGKPPSGECSPCMSERCAALLQACLSG